MMILNITVCNHMGGKISLKHSSIQSAEVKSTSSFLRRSLEFNNI